MADSAMIGVDLHINRKKRLVECNCPICGGNLACAFDEAGTVQTCPSCQRTFTVPGKAEVVKIIAAERLEEERRDRDIERRKLEDQQREAQLRHDAATTRPSRQTEIAEPRPPEGWGDALVFIGIILIALATLSLAASVLILFAGNESDRLQADLGIISSLSTIFVGCAFAGLGRVILLLRKILTVLEKKGI